MKTKFTKKGRRILSAALCLLMMITALPMSAFAWTSEEGKSCTSSFGDYYVGSDGEYYRSKAPYSFIVYDSNGDISVRTANGGNAKREYLMTDNSGTHQVYCVESGVDFNTGNSYVSESGKNSSYFQNLPTDAQFGIMMALMYGWHEGKSSPVAGTNADDYAFATQTIIWEYQQQLRTSPSNRQSANGIDGDTYYYSLKGRPAEKCYDWILSQMSKHYTIPIFAARSHFDISDTHEGYYGSRPVPIWQMNERYEQAVIERLSDRFGDVESTDLASVLMETAKNAVEDNLQDYMPQLKWCACFVSWCANECGYIENGIIPKFAGCIQGSEWFKERGQWQDGSFTPEAGHIIFFDWEGDGLTDHVGIVERVENGTVYTVEGNSGDACRQDSYSIGSSVIYGYGIPAY